MTTVRDAVAEVVKMPSSDPDAPGPFRYAETSRLLTLLDRAGFGELDARTRRGALAIGGGRPAAEAADFALASFSSFSELLAEAGAEAIHHARQSLTARFSGHQKDGAVRIDASVHLFTGARAEIR